MRNYLDPRWGYEVMIPDHSTSIEYGDECEGAGSSGVEQFDRYTTDTRSKRERVSG